MTTDHTELCERLRTENSCDEGFYEHCTEAADLIESQAARIAELAKERDALKADAERWRFSGTMFFRMMSPDMGGNHGWVANGRGVGRGNTLNAAIDARIAALQAEKEKSRG